MDISKMKIDNSKWFVIDRFDHMSNKVINRVLNMFLF